MNRDQMKGKWNQLAGKARARWGELTDDDMQQIEGNAQQLAGKLQERYGYTPRSRPNASWMSGSRL